MAGDDDLIAASGDLGAASFDVLSGLEELVDKSLLRIADADADAGDSEARFGMLQTIREFGLERLTELGEALALQGVHARYFLALAEEAEPALIEAEQVTWLRRLDAEHDNLRAALTECGREDTATELRLAGALWRFWWMRGHLSEGRRWLEAALARTGEAVPAVRAGALDGVGALAEAQGDFAEATTRHEAALALRRAAGDRLGAARSLLNLGIIADHDRGDHRGAKALHEEALALFRAENDLHGIASAVSNLGDVASAEGDEGQAAALYGEGLALARRLGNRQAISGGLNSLGVLAFLGGDSARAAKLYAESLEIYRELGDLPGVALALGNLGEVLQHQGELDRAEALYAEALPLSQDQGDQQGIAFLLSHLATVARTRGDLARAADQFPQGLVLSHQIDDRPRLAECLEGLAGVLAARGGAEPAAHLLGAAAAARETANAPLPAVHRAAYERDVGAVREALGEEGSAAAWDAGRAPPLAAVVAAAVGWVESIGGGGVKLTAMSSLWPG